MTNSTDWLPVAQVAAELNLSHRAVLHRITNGSIAATKLGDNTSAYIVARSEVERVKAEAGAA